LAEGGAPKHALGAPPRSPKKRFSNPGLRTTGVSTSQTYKTTAEAAGTTAETSRGHMETTKRAHLQLRNTITTCTYSDATHTRTRTSSGLRVIGHGLGTSRGRTTGDGGCHSVLGDDFGIFMTGMSMSSWLGFKMSWMRPRTDVSFCATRYQRSFLSPGVPSSSSPLKDLRA